MRTLDAPAGTEKKAPVVAVAIGRYCFLSRGCVLKPPGRVMKGYVLLNYSTAFVVWSRGMKLTKRFM